MMKKPHYLSICLFILFYLYLGLAQSEAQRYLILQKGGKQKSRIIYNEGDVITYKPKNVGYFMDDQITEITREFIVMSENIIRPDSIEAVDIRYTDERNMTIKTLSTLTAAAAGLLLTAETINSIYQEGKLSYSKGGLIVSGSLLAGSYILSKLKKKVFKNEGRNKIQIIYLDIENPDPID
ncbi:hypothetical protein KZP23_11015 [Echinicola marina]|uniref:hypothetical protein n=1 Tax=Echinicola marina TaxID=2859768 RepID=UPI001CF6449C|nr:hypothetical protein [Echinicola marina]UCS95496.1 hypothetical protein KZP23_11015 [Echinicola marina]